MNNFLYICYKHIRMALSNIRRHIAMSISAMSAVCVTLLLFGVFLLLVCNITLFTNTVEEDLRIHVVLNKDITTKQQINAIKQEIEGIDGVNRCTISTKDDELVLMMEEHGDALKMYEGDKNPLHHAFFVSVHKGDQLVDINAQISQLEGVEESVYGGTSVSKFISVLDTLRSIGLIFVVAFSFVTMLLIANSIKLTIYTRSHEIAIMRNVGATNSYIQIPFILEGMMIGLMGAILPCLATYLGYEYFYHLCGGTFVIRMFRLYSPLPFTIYICGFLCGFGILVGLCGSYYATHKYLKLTR